MFYTNYTNIQIQIILKFGFEINILKSSNQFLPSTILPFILAISQAGHVINFKKLNSA